MTLLGRIEELEHVTRAAAVTEPCEPLRTIAAFFERYAEPTDQTPPEESAERLAWILDRLDVPRNAHWSLARRCEIAVGMDPGKLQRRLRAGSR